MIEIITKGETPSEAKIKSIAVEWLLDTVKEETAKSIIKSIKGVIIRKSANRGSVTPPVILK